MKTQDHRLSTNPDVVHEIRNFPLIKLQTNKYKKIDFGPKLKPYNTQDQLFEQLVSFYDLSSGYDKPK